MQSKSDIKSVNRIELATLLKRSVVTIDSWVRKGMPYIQKNNQTNEWEFDVADVIQWREDQAVAKAGLKIEDTTVEELKKRKLIAEIEILEDDLQKRRQEVVKIAEAEQAVTHAFLTIKQRLRTIPERIRAQLASEGNEQACGEIVLNEIDDALLELSQLDFDGTKP